MDETEFAQLSPDGKCKYLYEVCQEFTDRLRRQGEHIAALNKQVEELKAGRHTPV
jgi:hypothetical protein